MAKNLVIVESPTKAKTISKFLGKEYKVLASMGHVRDLPKSKMGIDIENNFEPKYLIPADKKKTIKQLKDELEKAETLWIATDEDREGEAIGWHLLEALKVNKETNIHRIVFHEITKRAILEAIENPRQINQNTVDAQQARRILDRLVGYELSPLLWKKIRYGLSAGRVQSVAVRLVVEREREIKAFKPREYWEIDGTFTKSDKTEFTASLNKIKDKKADVKNEKSAKEVVKEVSNADFIISKVEKKKTKRNPAPPFTTSTLQQEAARKLGFSVKKTMLVAQKLYEGLETGNGINGLITYMRTDSVNLSTLATSDAKKVIEKEYGKKFTLDTPRFYKGKKSAQEAHEAIRPVDLTVKPEDIEQYLEKDMFKLYSLIWKRTIACQMQEAILNKVTIDINAQKNGKSIGYEFRATGQTIDFAGFMEVYMEGHDDEEEKNQNGEKLLPQFEEGESVKMKNILESQHFTKAPARYTEASLVKKLEDEGIGRPSTYAPTISTIMTRGYIEKDGNTLKPTDIADVVTDVLIEHFKEIVDYKFTAEMETKLDNVEEGNEKWVPMIKEFYEPFHKNIIEKEESLKKENITSEETNEICDKCGSKMMIKLGRFGKFLSCTNYPTCKNAKPLDGDSEKAKEASEEQKALQAKFADHKCSECGNIMEVKKGRFGFFLGCTNYPTCKHMESIKISSGVNCPECEKGVLIEKRTKKGGKLFWGCDNYPTCKFATWNKPVKIDKKTGKLMVENKDGEIVENKE